MATVLQLVKRLDESEGWIAAQRVTLRTYAGTADIEPWLQLHAAANPASHGSARRWGFHDFHREFLDKPWWRPESMWMARVNDPSDETRGDGHGVEQTGAFAPTRWPLIGTVTLGMRGRQGQEQPVVHWLLVAPHWRRRGVGRMLLSAVECECWKLGYPEIQLETLSHWTEAVAFYQAMGFVPQ